MESKFLEAIRKLVEYGNREFLRSFRLRPEIKEADNGNGNNNTNTNSNNNIITTDSASLIPPFETIGFLEAKWVEVLKGLVEYGNKNILGNFQLYLVMEERRVEEYVKEVTGILDINSSSGKEKEEVHQHHHNNGSNGSNNNSNNNRNNQS